VRYRIASAVAVTARLSSPLRTVRGAEAAVGAEWQPAAALPLRLLAERRQALGSDGRNAFALTLHGGVSELPLPAGLRMDAYAQAGVVGARSRDLFAEGTLRASRSLPAGFSLGVAAWGAAQPNVSRLDVGPTLQLPVRALRTTLLADWRVRVAGNAGPGSGPAFTLLTDF
jgi:hypothetical protein